VISTILYTLLCVAVSLLIAWVLIGRKKTMLGVILGLVPIAIMEVIFHGTLHIRIQRCLESACLSKGLPANCGLTEFGCTEWSGTAVFMFWAAGLVALVLYAMGATILAAKARRKSPVRGA
jgi:hypothetical protein